MVKRRYDKSIDIVINDTILPNTLRRSVPSHPPDLLLFNSPRRPFKYSTMDSPSDVDDNPNYFVRLTVVNSASIDEELVQKNYNLL